ncbi:hypothetical protein [Lewinella sp. IMCC34191]|uniref:hypothetical protein n=1 Tax=Lewinella sp. IMCC34191 TaxID=2259172 RepID=UPI000E2251C0|nr:hypothetical protein [Lewinella sp. IMCC34191]
MQLSKLLIIIIALFWFTVLPAQDAETDLTEQTRFNDRTRESMFNQQNPSAALAAGGAFYVSNPPPAYEVDAEKAYLDTEFVPFEIVLKDGQKYVLPGRIRLIDQKVEVKVDDEVFELDNQAVNSVTDANGRVFVPGFDPLARKSGAQWYQVAFSGKERRLLIQESTVWQDPPKKNMFDTSEPKKTLKRVTQCYLVNNGQTTEVDKMKHLLSRLGKDEGEVATDFVRRQRLKNEPEDFVALLEYMEKE